MVAAAVVRAAEELVPARLAQVQQEEALRQVPVRPVQAQQAPVRLAPALPGRTQLVPALRVRVLPPLGRPPRPGRIVVQIPSAGMAPAK
jgi:hypothetical protein